MQQLFITPAKRHEYTNFATSPMKYFLVFLFTLLLIASTFGQANPPLERMVSLDSDAVKVKDALDLIEQKSGCSFSYNSSAIDTERLVSVHAVNRPVREVLMKIFEGKVEFKQKNNFIILTKSQPAKKKITVAGYVENNQGQPVKGATVYDSNSLVSSTTNEYGYYEMRIERKLDPVDIRVSKTDYKDTLSPLKPSDATLQNFVIHPPAKDTTLRHIGRVIADSTKAFFQDFKTFLVKDNPEMINVSDTIYKDFQFSFLPFVGTNRKLSGNVINNYSINLIGGYSRGNNVLEIAGLFNASREDVKGLQFAGFANAIGGDARGLHFAGFTNFNAGELHGAQFAGFTNHSMKSGTGLQLAGFSNQVCSSFNGMQGSGFGNYCQDTLIGVQISGFGNYARKVQNGIQIGGFMNVAIQPSSAVQIAGFGNYACDSLSGSQIAGFMNFAARNVTGIQISGFLNCAKFAGGQVGFLNVADSVASVPIGFLSFVRKGYHKLEISADEIYKANLSFRTGVHRFYNIFNVGVMTDFKSDTVDWSFGYGIGTAPKLSRRSYLNFDLTSNQVIRGNLDSKLNLLNKLYTGYEFHLTRKISLAAGATINGYLTDINATDKLNSNGRPHLFYSKKISTNLRLDSWIGWKVAIRFG
jgi:hypothetical protein